MEPRETYTSERPGTAGQGAQWVFGTNKFTEEDHKRIQEALNSALSWDQINSRPGGGGKKVHYLAGHTVIENANRIFGFSGWDSSILHLSTDYVERTEDGRYWTAAATAIVRVALSNGSGHEDVGNAHLKDKDKGEVIERAKKAAVTDATKRALRLFGRHLGGNMSDKEGLTDLERTHRQNLREVKASQQRDAADRAAKQRRQQEQEQEQEQEQKQQQKQQLNSRTSTKPGGDGESRTAVNNTVAAGTATSTAADSCGTAEGSAGNCGGSTASGAWNSSTTGSRHNIQTADGGGSPNERPWQPPLLGQLPQMDPGLLLPSHSNVQQQLGPESRRGSSSPRVGHDSAGGGNPHLQALPQQHQHQQQHQLNQQQRQQQPNRVQTHNSHTPRSVEMAAGKVGQGQQGQQAQNQRPQQQQQRRGGAHPPKPNHRSPHVAAQQTAGISHPRPWEHREHGSSTAGVLPERTLRDSTCTNNIKTTAVPKATLSAGMCGAVAPGAGPCEDDGSVGTAMGQQSSGFDYSANSGGGGGRRGVSRGVSVAATGTSAGTTGGGVQDEKYEFGLSQDFESAFFEIDSAIQRHNTSLSGDSSSPGDSSCFAGGGSGAVSSGRRASVAGGSAEQNRENKRLRT